MVIDWEKTFLRKRSGEKLLMSQLKDVCAGQPAAILGGGPSLPGDMARLPIGCLLIAVNYHAMRLCDPTYMVYNDHPESDPLLEAAVRDFQGIKVSPGPTSDILFDVPVWTGFYSSQTAAWLGLWMGCDPVILCGMDCYQGERKYFHPYEDKPHFHYPLQHHLQSWEEDARNLLPNWRRVKVMSGPLITLFGPYLEGK
jgi:hypothetical protein